MTPKDLKQMSDDANKPEIVATKLEKLHVDALEMFKVTAAQGGYSRIIFTNSRAQMEGLAGLLRADGFQVALIETHDAIQVSWV